MGRNKSKPLNDDDFLRAHWMMYFKFSRQTGRDYIKFLLEEQFTPQRVHRKIVQPVTLEEAEEQTSDADLESDDENGVDEVESSKPKVAELRPNEISEYVKSLKVSSVRWFDTYYPEMSDELTGEETEWIQRLNRLGMAYFRPLLMAILKKCADPGQRIGIFKEIERFVFVMFRLTQARSNYRSSEFSNAVRAIDRGDMDLVQLKERLRNGMSFAFSGEGHFASDDFYMLLQKKFENGQGYYDWPGLRYFLYEYELELLSGSRQKKVDWADLLKTPKDKISIEHIYPKSETEEWKPAFKSICEQEREAYRNSLGNLLLLSSAINSRCRTMPSPKRRSPSTTAMAVSSATVMQTDRTRKSKSPIPKIGGPMKIRRRGIRLIRFMEKHWDICFADDQARERCCLSEASMAKSPKEKLQNELLARRRSTSS